MTHPHWNSHFTTYQVISEDIRSGQYIELIDCVRMLRTLKRKFPDEHFRVQRVERYDSVDIEKLLSLLKEHKVIEESKQ